MVDCFWVSVGLVVVVGKNLLGLIIEEECLVEVEED